MGGYSGILLDRSFPLLFLAEEEVIILIEGEQIMVQVDFPAAFAIGQIYGLLSKEYLKKDPRIFTNRLLGPLNFFLSCGFAPGGLFLLVGWPAWEVMYTTPWVEDPYNKPLVAGFYVLFMIIMVVLGNVGFILAHHWYQIGKDRWVLYGSAAGVILTIFPFLLRWGVWLNIGTYSEVAANSGYSFWKPPFFSGWLVLMSYLAVSIIGMGVWLKTKGSQLEP
jgi:hypothetical protein